MKRREFFGKTGCGALGMMMAYFGLSSCKKKEEAETAEAAAQAQAPEQEAPMEEMSRKDMVKKMLIEKKGVTEEEADAMIAEFEEMLPMVKEKCICKTCPTYVAEETEQGFCHPLVGKSKIITEEKGCNCPQCPIYTEKQMKNGYYCTRNSEMEQEMAKMG
ncbi:MAG: DUF2769 domain-containing protein [Candidatus Aminicenantes bacterium]|nr:DUF2769 domain-containing protein [Candidatus Aminicenantes bacterium]